MIPEIKAILKQITVQNSSTPAEKAKDYRFTKRMKSTPRSFIREILKVTQSPDVISFAGGLPNPALIDTAGIAKAARAVLARDGSKALQYATTEGDPSLREFISERYKKRLGLDIPADEILITNGSQQCLDLIGKVFIDPKDDIAIERPGYLGAIQAFSLYEPRFHAIPLGDNGPDPSVLERTVKRHRIRLMYGIPNSQNPSGITYSAQRREETAQILAGTSAIFVEDDAYGELTFSGRTLPSMRSSLPDQTILTGSFSKILAPGMRLGWISAPPPVMEKIIVAKQATDLHSNYLSQRIASQYLSENNIDAHITNIRNAYHAQCTCMLDRIRAEFPDGVRYTKPAGGMFIWITLPAGCCSMEVFESALKEHIAVLPGIPFYVDGGGTDTLRLNFSNSDEMKIRAGIQKLGSVIAALSGA
ncbi:MAG: Aspartate aminotransferase [Methanoregula sp. PtaU1.Bin051]|nr:MAG: Aspartate aminotransferase [Methanoregula sp. PtaU1.Bin051]